jgi:hypothetical protein
MKFRALLAIVSAASSLYLAAPAGAASPVITNQTNSVSAIYPVVDGYADTISFSWAIDQPVQTLQIDIVSTSTGQSVFSDGLVASATSYLWNGKLADTTLPADGTYYSRITATNAGAEVDSNNGPLFTISGKKLTQHTLTKQVTAAGSLEIKLAGRCSQVRQPGLKLGTGSLGYYSNTKCTSAHQDMAVSIHHLAVPASLRPGNARLSAYGVAAKAGSVMRIGFLGDAVPFKIGSAKGWHTGPLVPAARSIHNNQLEWGALATAGNRYDIKYFKITYTYTTLD